MAVSFMVQYRTLMRASQNMNQHIQDANYEMTSGKKANLVGDLGGRIESYFNIKTTSQTLDNRETRFTAALNKMEVTQKTLDSVRTMADELLSSLEADNYTATSESLDLVRSSAVGTLQDFESLLNIQWGQVSLFSGDASEEPAVSGLTGLIDIARDVIDDYLTGGGTLATNADVDTLLTQISAIFTNTTGDTTRDFGTAIYTGGDGELAGVEIYDGEVVNFGVKANDPELMSVMKGAVILATSDLIENNSSAEVRRYYTSRGLDALREGKEDIVNIQAKVGTVQQRVDVISEGILISNTYFKIKVQEMHGADIEAATVNLSAWQTQLNAAYYAISQIKTLSLVNYLR